MGGGNRVFSPTAAVWHKGPSPFGGARSSAKRVFGGYHTPKGWNRPRLAKGDYLFFLSPLLGRGISGRQEISLKGT